MDVERYPIRFAWDDANEPAELESFVTFNPTSKELGLVMGEMGHTFGGLLYMRVVSPFSNLLYTVDIRENGYHLPEFFASTNWNIFRRASGRMEVYQHFLGRFYQHTFKARVKNGFSFEFSFGSVEVDACKGLGAQLRKVKDELRELRYSESELANVMIFGKFSSDRYLINEIKASLKLKTSELEKLKDVEARRLAVAMAFHSRSGLGRLDPSVVVYHILPHLLH